MKTDASFSEISIAGWLFINMFQAGIDSRIMKKAEMQTYVWNLSLNSNTSD